MTMKIDKLKWNHDRIEIEMKIHSLKREIRSQSCPPYRAYRELAEAKLLATRLYQLRAHLRGRLHQQKEVWYGRAKHVIIRTMVDQGSEIEMLLERYVLPQAA
jgi:hypothetical protein